jgi:hypothetical protein
MTFDARVQGTSAGVVDITKIKKDVLGLNESAIRSYFKNLKEVESVHIVLSPFWIKSIPKDPSKVKITVDK